MLVALTTEKMKSLTMGSAFFFLVFFCFPKCTMLSVNLSEVKLWKADMMMQQTDRKRCAAI